PTDARHPHPHSFPTRRSSDLFSEVWRKQYPSCVRSWEDNWDILCTFFEYPPEIRKIIYTTNIIEGLNRQFRQITKNKPSFTNDRSEEHTSELQSRFDLVCRLL